MLMALQLKLHSVHLISSEKRITIDIAKGRPPPPLLFRFCSFVLVKRVHLSPVYYLYTTFSMLPTLLLRPAPLPLSSVFIYTTTTTTTTAAEKKRKERGREKNIRTGISPIISFHITAFLSFFVFLFLLLQESYRDCIGSVSVPPPTFGPIPASTEIDERRPVRDFSTVFCKWRSGVTNSVSF